MHQGRAHHRGIATIGSFDVFDKGLHEFLAVGPVYPRHKTGGPHRPFPRLHFKQARKTMANALFHTGRPGISKARDVANLFPKEIFPVFGKPMPSPRPPAFPFSKFRSPRLSVFILPFNALALHPHRLQPAHYKSQQKSRARPAAKGSIAVVFVRVPKVRHRFDNKRPTIQKVGHMPHRRRFHFHGQGFAHRAFEFGKEVFVLLDGLSRGHRSNVYRDAGLGGPSIGVGESFAFHLFDGLGA